MWIYTLRCAHELDFMTHNPLEDISITKKETWHQNLTEQELLEKMMQETWEVTESEAKDCIKCKNFDEDESNCGAFNYRDCPTVIKSFNLTNNFFQ